MSKHSIKNIVFTVIIAATAITATAQKVQEPKITNEEWTKDYEPFRIAGNLYYVGTYDLASYLITTNEGNILINTGLASSARQIKDNIETLGFKFGDTKILLTTQVHYDHMGAMAAVKAATGAQLLVDEKEAEEIKTGGSSDYALGAGAPSFKPVTADRLLKDGDTIALGEMKLLLLHHPGHTKGSCSYLFTVTDEQKSYKVLIANMPTIVTEKAFPALTAYPTVAADYAYTLNAMKNIQFDIWLASHASQFKLHTKRQAGEGYNPAAFSDQAGYDEELKELQKDYEEKMKQH